MRDWHFFAVHLGSRPVGYEAGGLVRDDLVAVEIEVDPVVAAAPFSASHEFAVKFARGGQVVDREG